MEARSQIDYIALLFPTLLLCCFDVYVSVWCCVCECVLCVVYVYVFMHMCAYGMCMSVWCCML